jgi:leucyl aminopeptidase
VLGTIYAAADIGLKQNITAVVVATENAIDSHSYKPGDVYKSYFGHTVEIGNTDAEGRLVLADAMAYACDHLKPTRLINFATLTGAIDIALGYEASGLFASDDRLSDQLVAAGQATYERAWRMPLFDEYRDVLKSDIADMRNVGGRSGGSIIAAIFLKEFVDKKIPWAHFDIAATAFWSDAKRYYPKYATGVGVRLMIEFLESVK